jgi:hypothetical protein
MTRYLVVANQTLGGKHLVGKMRELLDRGQGPSSFFVLVPATPPQDTATWTEGESVALARERLDRALETFRGAGFEVEGAVGDEDPVLAVRDELRNLDVDEIVLSTLPAGGSRWLKMDLPSRLQRLFDMPVHHVIAGDEPQGGS